MQFFLSEFTQDLHMLSIFDVPELNCVARFGVIAISFGTPNCIASSLNINFLDGVLLGSIFNVAGMVSAALTNSWSRKGKNGVTP